MPPRSASRAFILGSARTGIDLFVELVDDFGRRVLGRADAVPALASYPGTNSPTVGTSGSASERVAVVTASARSLPALMYSIDEGIGQT